MKKSAAIAALLGVIAVCLFVVYRYAIQEIDDGYVTPRERAIIKEFDADRDGKLNPEERKLADAAIREMEQRRREERIRRLDRNGDGKVSAEEEAAARMEAEERRKEWIRKYDTDGDGKISRSEEEAAAKSEREDLLRKFDRDGDGTLSGDERKEAGDSLRTRSPARP